MASYRATLDGLLRRVQLSETNILILLSAVVGLVTALGAIGFTALIIYFYNVFFGLTDQALMQTIGQRTGSIHWWLPLIPMFGGLLVGPIVFKFASEAQGHGVPEVMNAVARLGGVIRPRVAVAKTIASAICLGSGGSAGREGPIVQVGAAIGSTIGQVMRMSTERVKILVACGAAAGISAVFNAPIAGAIFALEIILGDFAIRSFSPVIISSVVASVLTRSIVGNAPAFSIPSYSLVSWTEIIWYCLLGGIVGVLGVAFNFILDWFEKLFEKIPMPKITRPALGGLLLGCLALMYPQILADGYETITLTLYGKLALSLMIPLILMKMVATSMTLGSGSSGGLFAPSLFTGAVAGGSFGSLVHWLFPSSTATPGAYAVVGMAGFVAAATHAPMTAMLIIFELTSDYRIILPLMICVVFSTLVARKLCEHSMYTFKLAKRGIEIRGGKDVNILRAHRVSEIMDRSFERIVSTTTLRQLLALIERTRESYFIVETPTGELKGVLTFQDIREFLSKSSLADLVIAEDIVVPQTVVVRADEDLEHANRMFAVQDLRLIPVVESAAPTKVIGVLRREDLLTTYNRQLVEVLQN